MDNYFKTDHDRDMKADDKQNHFFNNIIACFKMEEGYCIKDGVVNYFNPSCYQNLKRFLLFHFSNDILSVKNVYLRMSVKRSDFNGTECEAMNMSLPIIESQQMNTQ